MDGGRKGVDRLSIILEGELGIGLHDRATQEVWKGYEWEGVSSFTLLMYCTRPMSLRSQVFLGNMATANHQWSIETEPSHSGTWTTSSFNFFFQLL